MATEAETIIARTLAEHELYGGGFYCMCTPVDEDGRRDRIEGTVEDHLAAAVVAALAGDPPEPEEFAMLTPAQTWASLLRAPAEERLERLEHILEAGRRGTECFTSDHEHALEELRARRLEDAARVLENAAAEERIRD